MKTTTISYPSRDGRTTIHALVWEPSGAAAAEDPLGVVQIVHGMSEHVERYERFAAYLVERGFTVCANDHVGHGGSLAAPEDLGHIPLETGVDVLVEDVHALRGLVMARLAEAGAPADLPYVIFGHSMGSFVTRVYLARHAFGVRAAVVCGTGQQAKPLVTAALVITSLLARIHGERYKSKLVDSLGTGGYGKAIPDAKTPLDWLSTSRENVTAYQNDPLCGQMFTVGGYHTVGALAGDAQKPELVRAIPKALPMLFIAGGEDPVGEQGAGVERAVEMYRAAGMERVDLKLYQGYRHEILNEPCAGEVMEDVVTWLDGLGI